MAKAPVDPEVAKLKEDQKKFKEEQKKEKKDQKARKKEAKKKAKELAEEEARVMDGEGGGFSVFITTVIIILVGLKELVEQAGGTVVGAGIAVEKVFQGGGELLKSKGMRVESLARIAAMSDHSLEFVQY